MEHQCPDYDNFWRIHTFGYLPISILAPHITLPSSRFPKDIQVGITKRFFLLQSDQVP